MTIIDSDTGVVTQTGSPPDLPGVFDAPPSPKVPSRLGRGMVAVGWATIGALGFLALWQFGASRAADLPSPSEGLGKLVDLLSDPFYDNGPNDKGIGVQLWVSLLRVAKGFSLAVVVGVPVGLLIGSSRKAWNAFNPIVQLLRPVSPLAWYPVWLAVSDDPPRAAIIVIFITALWPTLINTAASVATIPQEQKAVAAVFRFSRLAYFRHVVVPNTIPGIVTGLRLSMGIAWMVIVAVEMMAGSTGIGFYVWDSYNVNQLDAVVASIFLIGGVGFTLDFMFLRLSRRYAPEVVK